MRTFKEISEQELEAKVDETFYYYLINEIVESKKANDQDALKEALDIAVTYFEKRDELTKEILEEVKANMCQDASYEDFEDTLFQTVEHNIY